MALCDLGSGICRMLNYTPPPSYSSCNSLFFKYLQLLSEPGLARIFRICRIAEFISLKKRVIQWLEKCLFSRLSSA
jgi:hypothetical protein